MMGRPHDCVIRNGVLVSGSGQAALDVAITDGKISGLLQPGTEAPAHRTVDASHCYVLPGGIDTHTHVSWPLADGGRTDDGFANAGRAAALGGTTTIVDFVPPLGPEQRLIDAARDRIAEIEAGSPIDVALHPILNRCDAGILEDIPAVIDLGLTSFKMYTTYDDRVNDGQIWTLMQAIVAAGGLPGFHAENHDVLSESLNTLVAVGRTSVRDFPDSRPALAEATAIKTVAHMAHKLDSPVYIFHVSGREALAAIADSIRAGATVHTETCTHYLCFDDSVFAEDAGWKYVITPPIRAAQDRQELWHRMADDAITSVGSDHCAYCVTSKSAHPDDHRLTPPGAAGIEARTPVLWDLTVNHHRLSPSDFVRSSSENAAKALGMWPRKGALHVGSDADIVILDPQAQWSGARAMPASGQTFTLYDQYVGRGRARHVFVRGAQVVRDEQFLAESVGAGHFLARERVHSASATNDC
jgi:dihydropyrimidinase